ncbi:MAG: tetratricopeptide repeat protein [Candidatus Aminicenantes bacterium]|nr:tetratricopeptide repeat protein [Candidatus Aminicenantes bacterium]
MIFKTLNIKVSDTQIKKLKDFNQKVTRHLEEEFPLKLNVLEGLKVELSGIVNQSHDWQEVLQAVHDSEAGYCLRLMHRDNEILNMPWSIAVDGISNQPLGSIKRLHLSKSIPGCFDEKGFDFPKTPAPLKILIMISSPEDTEWKYRLSYEDEEKQILKAFEPLMHTGEIEVDFTEDGSLEALERKLKANKYHILHFSGHAIFNEKDNTGYLQLEDPLDLKTHLTEAADFARVINCNPKHQVPIIMLSSCQTARGNSEGGLRGVTNQLLQQGVPAVISMGMAIKDFYAAQFSAYFYRLLAEKQTIHSAFYDAVQHLKEKEEKVIKNTPGNREIPLQWIIPNLYLSRSVEEVIDWKQPTEKLQFISQDYIFGRNRMILSHEKDYRFIGRRKEKAGILRPFFEKVPILLKGQGGVGKTAMVEHLVQRLIAKVPKTIPFLFDESIRSIKEILDRMQDFLLDREHEHVIANVNQYEKVMDKFRYLLFQINETYKPVFVFDNLESFQKEPGEDFSEEYSDLKEVIAFLCERQICHVMLTCRYPVPGFKNLRSFDLNQVGLTDFWKKCIYLDVGAIYIHLRVKASHEKAKEGFLARPGLQYIEVVKLLHETFGGNYWALERFDTALKERPDEINNFLDSLEDFRKKTEETAVSVKQEMSQKLLFSKLMDFLSPEQQKVLELLSHFRIPVQKFALQLQLQNHSHPHPIDFKPILQALNRLTLIEITIDPEISTLYYYVTPIVKDLLNKHYIMENTYSFSNKYAGIYHYYFYYNLGYFLTQLEESFYYFEKFRDEEKTKLIGGSLTRFFKDNAMYNCAFNYAHRTYQVLGNNSDGEIFSTIGLYYRLIGESNKSLYFNNKALSAYQKSGNQISESALLNNIGRLHIFLGDYNAALKYLKPAIKICRETGNKQGECAALNHIGEIYNTRGDFKEALKHHKESLKISLEINDKKAEGSALNNLGRVYVMLGDYNKARKYAEQSLEISREMGDRWEVGTTLNNVGEVYRNSGDFDIAMKYFEQALKIFQELGNKPHESVTLNNIALVYSNRKDYDLALKHLKRSLKIKKITNDKSGEGTTLNAIGGIYYHRKDYENSLKFVKKSLDIRQRIGDKRYEGDTLNTIAQIYYNLGDLKKAVKYLEKLQKYCEDIGDKQKEEEILHKICHYLYLLREYDKAFEYVKRSLKLSSELGNKSGKITAFHNKALIAHDRGLIEEFMKIERNAYKMAKEIKDNRNIFIVGSHLGTKLYHTGKKGEGLSLLKESYKIGKEADYPDVVGVEQILKKIGEL